MTIASQAAASIAAVVVSYFPDDRFGDRIRVLSQQVDQVIIVDNGDTVDLSSRILSNCSGSVTELISSGGNVGVARALNIGIERARSLGANWVATFDQDSEVQDDYRANMMRAWSTLHQTSQIALLAPVYVYQSIDEASIRSVVRRHQDTPSPREVTTVMTSGNLVPCATFDRVGPFREDFVIDYVDHEFCLRCKKAGMRIYEVPDVALFHRLGRIERIKRGPISATVTHHDAVRRYFMTRNRMCVWKEYGIRNPLWTARDMMSSVKELAKIALFESQKRRKYSAILEGVGDALRGRMGWSPYAVDLVSHE